MFGDSRGKEAPEEKLQRAGEAKGKLHPSGSAGNNPLEARPTWSKEESLIIPESGQQPQDEGVYEGSERSESEVEKVLLAGRLKSFVKN